LQPAFSPALTELERSLLYVTLPKVDIPAAGQAMPTFVWGSNLVLTKQKKESTINKAYIL